jgi:hypothetical protein
MSPAEVWTVAEARKPPPKVGNMPLAQFEHLSRVLDDATAQAAAKKTG